MTSTVAGAPQRIGFATAQAAYEANLDGINATSQRGKSGAGSSAAITFRVENIEEFTVQSGELPPSQGGGQS